jgi:hypothetical protein
VAAEDEAEGSRTASAVSPGEEKGAA